MHTLTIKGQTLTTPYQFCESYQLDTIDCVLLGQWSLSHSTDSVSFPCPQDTLIQFEFAGQLKRYYTVPELQALAPESIASSVFSELETVRIWQFKPSNTLQPLQQLQQWQRTYLKTSSLYQCANPTVLTLKAVSAIPLINRSQPILLLLPDVLGSIQDSFAALWQPRSNDSASRYLQRLFQPYGQQVFGFEYDALITHLVVNAQQLLKQLPQGAEIHCLGYGVGGVLAELLSMAAHQALTETDYQALQAQGESELAQELRELLQLAAEKKLNIKKVLHVASPLRGWALAQESLTSIASWLLAVQPTNSNQSAQNRAEFIAAWLGVAHSLQLKTEDLAGLSALRPTSALVRLLNSSTQTLSGQSAHLIAAWQGVQGLDRWLQTYFNPALTSGDYDRLVLAEAAFGGWGRSAGSYRCVITQTITHEAYWQSSRCLESILSGLHDPSSDPAWQLVPTPSFAIRSAPQPQPPISNGIVVFLPGLLASELSINDTLIWLSDSALRWGDVERLSLGVPVQVGGIIGEDYALWLQQLQAQYRVIPFAYDWRLPQQDAVNALSTLLKQLLQERDAQGLSYPIRLVAHSAGGLVAWGFVQTQPLVWQRLCDVADARLVLVGAPLAGTSIATQWLRGEHRLIQMLDTLEGREDKHLKLAALWGSFAGVVELLPENALTSANWQVQPDAVLDANRTAATAWRTQLTSPLTHLERVLYVRGEAGLTPVEWSAEQGWQATTQGDGVVSWASIPRQLAQWHLPAEHGQLLSVPRYFNALLELVSQGHTTSLARVLPQTSTAKLVRFPLLTLTHFPSFEEVRAAALGYHTQITRSEILPPVELWVTQGNLEHASRVVAVGHYEATEIVNAESALDQRLNGRLRALHRLGVYAGALNSSELVLNTEKQPAGALVVGLGEVGKLSLQSLTATYAQALLRYALLQSEAALKPVNATESVRVPLNLSSLLVGSAAGGLSLREVLLAILRAIQHANRTLAKQAADTPLRLHSLELIELYADKALEAAKLLQELCAQAEFRDDFALTSGLCSLPGGYTRVMYQEPSEWWQRLQIIAGAQGLSFVALTARARAEAILQPTQRHLVDEFVTKALATPQALDCEVGKVLFEMLLPNPIKEQTTRIDHWVLVLNSAAAAYPWELLQNRADAEQIPLAVRTGLVRQLQTEQFRQTVITPNSRSALIIGDPPVTMLKRLTAARQEAERVAVLLQQYDFTEVVREIDTPADAVLCALYKQDYRVLHLAGHGVYRYQRADGVPVTGMVLGDNAFLTAVEIQQMRQVPELVFVNCCYLGTLDQANALEQSALEQRHEFAASFAEALIGMGVRVAIVAGWAIGDEPAKLFAETLYQALLKGNSFGDAVLQARRDTWRFYPDSNTWGAYQCYGDPDYRLVQATSASEDSSAVVAVPQFLAPFEVHNELDNLINASDSLRLGEYDWLLKKAQLLEQITPPDWLKEAAILSRLGRVYSKLDQFAAAIRAYKGCLQADKSEFVFGLFEDLVSVQTAYALRLYQYPSDTPHDPNALMQEAWLILLWLSKVGNVITPPPYVMAGAVNGQTQSRLEELARYWKRMSMMTQGHDQQIALQQMELAYARVNEFLQTFTHDVATYPLVNWITCRLVRYQRQEQLLTEGAWQILREALQKAQLAAEQQETVSPNFNAAVNRVEVRLTQYLMAEGNERPSVASIVQGYQEALARGAPPRKIRFVSEHLDFLTITLKDTEFANTEQAMLNELHEPLKLIWELLPATAR